MNKLLINTATPSSELVLLANGKLYTRRWNDIRNGLEHLLPKAKELLLEANIKWADLGELIVVIGPGGFMALRLATSFANTLVQELNVGLKTIDTANYLLARINKEENENYVVVLNGGGQFYQFYNPKVGKYELVEKTKLQGYLPQDCTVITEESELDHYNIENFEQLVEKSVNSSWPIEPQYLKEPNICIPKKG